MKKGYWVVCYRSISDPDTLANKYRPLAVAAVESFGGRFLTSPASRIEAHESGLAIRTTLIEFESYDKALAAHASDAYKKALDALGSAVDRDLRIVEGV